MKRIKLLLATILLLAVAGCSLPFDSAQPDTSEQGPVVNEQDPPASWTLYVDISEPNPEPGEQVQARVATARQFRGTAYGVRIPFINENKSLINEIPVGNLTVLGQWHTVNTTAPEPPFYVTAKMDGWDTPGMEPKVIKGDLYRSDGINTPYEVTNISEFIYNSSSG